MNLADEYQDISNDTTRMTALSDGVISISMTLLVFNFKVPDLPRTANSNEIYAAVLRQIPTLISVGVAFFSISIWWLAHKRVFRYIQRYDRKLGLRNLLFLFTITLVPFFSGLMGTFPHLPMFAVVQFAILGTVGLQLGSIWNYAQRMQFVVDGIPPRLAQLIRMRSQISGLVFWAGAVVSYWQPQLGAFIPAVIPLILKFWQQRLVTDALQSPDLSKLSESGE